MATWVHLNGDDDPIEEPKLLFARPARWKKTMHDALVNVLIYIYIDR